VSVCRKAADAASGSVDVLAAIGIGVTVADCDRAGGVERSVGAVVAVGEE